MLIKHCFLMGKIPFKQNNGLISVIRTLIHRKQRLIGGMPTLNAVVQTQMTLNALVAQIQQLSRKTLKKKIHKFVLADRKLKLRDITEELEISEGSVCTILHEHLSMEKLYSKRVLLRLLTVNQNNNDLAIQNVVCNCFNATKYA